MKSEANFALPGRLLALLLGLTLVVTLVATTGTAQAQANKGSAVAIPVTGELADGGTFKGKILNPEVSAKKNDKLSMSGTLKGKAETEAGEVKKVNEEFKTSVKVQETGQTFQAAQASCPILSLDLGPLNLDLLGLVVDLAPVNLDVTAVPGAGNLLGNLLCAVAGLLDAPDLSGVLANLLNALLEGLFGNLFS